MENYLTRTAVYAILVFVVGCTQSSDSQSNKNETDAKKQTTTIPKNDIPETTSTISKLTEIVVQEQNGRILNLKDRQANKAKIYVVGVDELVVAEKSVYMLAPYANASFHLGDIRAPSEPINRENYAHYDDNPVKRVVSAWLISPCGITQSISMVISIG